MIDSLRLTITFSDRISPALGIEEQVKDLCRVFDRLGYDVTYSTRDNNPATNTNSITQLLEPRVNEKTLAILMDRMLMGADMTKEPPGTPPRPTRAPAVLADIVPNVVNSDGPKSKDDDSKLPMQHLPWAELEDVSRIMKYGADKYNDHGYQSWKYLEDGEARYIGAALRHISRHQRDEAQDQESKLLHLAHAACDVLFALYHAKQRLNQP